MTITHTTTSSQERLISTVLLQRDNIWYQILLLLLLNSFNMCTYSVLLFNSPTATVSVLPLAHLSMTGTASDDSHPTSHKHTDHWTCVLVSLQGNTPQALLHSGSDDPPALYPGHSDQAIHSHMSYLEWYWNTSQLEMHCMIMDESYDGHHNKHTEEQVFQ